MHSKHIEPRISIAHCDKQNLTVVVAYFSHVANERPQQWRHLRGELAHLPSISVVLLADHNSLIIPAQDAAKPPQTEPNTVVEARETELAVLGSLKLEDAWNEIHYDPETQDTKIGFTFAYNVGKAMQLDRLQRIDPIHVSNHLMPVIATAFTVFLARADHNAAVCELSPPTFCHQPSRWKCPVGFLTDAQTVRTLQNWLDKVQDQELPPLEVISGQSPNHEPFGGLGQ